MQSHLRNAQAKQIKQVSELIIAAEIRQGFASRCRANWLAWWANEYQVSARPCSPGSHPCTVIVIRREPHPERLLKLFVLLGSALSILRLNLSSRRNVPSVACECRCKACGRKEGRKGRPTFPGQSLDSAGHPLSRGTAVLLTWPGI